MKVKVLLAGLALACGSAAAASAARPLPYRDNLHAMYVVDHQGRNPVVAVELLAYSMPFQKILLGCKTTPYALTMRVINLSNKASELGAREVTNLQMLTSVAYRITWKKPRGCSFLFNLVEGRLEAGNE